MIREKNKLFYVGLKAFIEKDGALLLLKQSDHYGKERKWQLPGGRIAHGEGAVAFPDILSREIREECGEVKIKIGEMSHVFRRKFPSGEWVLLLCFDCHYISGEVKLNGEHTEYAWVTLAEMEKYEFVHGYKDAIQTYFQKKR